MKRTIKEIYDLVCQKLENAQNERYGLVQKGTTTDINVMRRCERLSGEMMAYFDIKVLMETSGVLEEKDNAD